MKIYKLIIGCCLLLLGAISPAAAQMPGTPYFTGHKILLACATPSGLTITNSTPSITSGGTASFILNGTNMTGATWTITPSTGVSPASGSTTSTGAVTFANAGSYTVTYTATNSGSCATATAAPVSTTETVNAVCAIVAPTISSVIQPTCANNKLGTIVMNTQTGAEYSVNNGSSYQASNTFSNLAPGTYTLKVRNATTTSCTSSTITQVLTDPGTCVGVISSITCNTAATGGMRVGYAVSGVKQTITVNVTSIGTYNITTNTVAGVKFSASGTYTTTGSQTVILTATGTPTASSAAILYTLNTTPSCGFYRGIAPAAGTLVSDETFQYGATNGWTAGNCGIFGYWQAGNFPGNSIMVLNNGDACSDGYFTKTYSTYPGTTYAITINTWGGQNGGNVGALYSNGQYIGNFATDDGNSTTLYFTANSASTLLRVQNAGGTFQMDGGILSLSIYTQ